MPQQYGCSPQHPCRGGCGKQDEGKAVGGHLWDILDGEEVHYEKKTTCLVGRTEFKSGPGQMESSCQLQLNAAVIYGIVPCCLLQHS